MAWDKDIVEVERNFATKFDVLSLASCSLELKGLGRSKQASGFFWRQSDQIFLVTNWHVVTGLHAFQGVSLDNGWVPEEVTARYWTIKHLENDRREFQQRRTTAPLFLNFDEPCWRQHKAFSENRADLVCLPMPIPPPEATGIYCLNDYDFAKLFHSTGSDIFIVGFPLPREAGDNSINFPIWKRGSVASEMLFPWNGHPAFLIDCRTSGGMSGSPAYRRTFGPAVSDELRISLDAVVTTEFVGIYSGRISDDDGNASIGIVWGRHLLADILSDHAPGSRC